MTLSLHIYVRKRVCILPCSYAYLGTREDQDNIHVVKFKEKVLFGVLVLAGVELIFS